MLLRHVQEPVVRDNADHAFRKAHHVMVETLQSEAMQVREIPWKVDFEHLALPARHVLRAGKPAVQQDYAVGKLGAGAHDEAIGRVSLTSPRITRSSSELIVVRNLSFFK